MKIGVLALQGSFIEHIAVMQQLGVEVAAIRLPHQLDGLDALIIPGGESTTMLELMRNFGLLQPLRELAQAGLPILGTCAGMICLAKTVSNHNMETLAVMDLAVRRNAFGRQIDSFETELPIPVLGDKPFPAIFIRSPIIEGVDSQVDILARLTNSTVVAAKQGKVIAAAFHPELSDDSRLHRYFLSIVAKNHLGDIGDRGE
jgi:5'-phosphate synthase pdxT subunit